MARPITSRSGGFSFNEGLATHLTGKPLPADVVTLMGSLLQYGFQLDVTTDRAGKTLNVLKDGQRFGYINGNVLRLRGVLGYHFAQQGRANSCPPSLLPSITSFFCNTYGCTEADFATHQGTGSNDRYTYLVVLNPAIALRAVLLDAQVPLSAPISGSLPQLAEIEDKFEAALKRSAGDTQAARLQRLADAPKQPARLHTLVGVFVRNADVVAEVLFQARGICGNCNEPAPFTRRSDGTPYLEVHHRRHLADGGEDTVANAIALCPNCHRLLHYGAQQA